ncbi:hypothetical protein EDC96DRAFT_447095 [Choanephora cucurbitarum]|nr:hypothetical protein EDC96DRAFT_447095 [Choanephora cucurbitarum]
MAAVSFLETTNLVGLGLSADKVISHVIDFNATKSDPLKKPVVTNQSNPSGLKLVSDVMDSSYRVFDGLGKFWQRNTHELENKSSSKDAAPIAKFLEMKSVDELKIGEVTELLADYKRLAAMVKQAGLV